MKNVAKIRPNLAIFTKLRFSQNYTGTDSGYKYHARKPKYGLEVPLYSFYKPVEQFFEFLIFFENMDYYVKYFGSFGHFVRIFEQILKKVKN